MMTIQEILDLSALYDTYYGQLRAEQATDELYYDDKFEAHIPDPYRVKRTGMARKIVNTIAENIITTNPKASRDPVNATDAARDRNNKVVKLLNIWLELLMSPIQAGVKYLPLRGEMFYQVEFNVGDKRPLLYAPDPMFIYPDPVENQGIPLRVIKKYQTKPSMIAARYPNFKDTGDRAIEYLAFWDNPSRYISADKIILSKGVEPNVWKTVPFIHAYSGQGVTAPDVPPEKKVVGKLRELRDILVEECGLESMIYSIIGLWANPTLILWRDEPGAEISPEEAKSIDLSAGSVVRLPPGMQHKVIQGTAPSPEIFRHLDNVRARLGLEVPPITAGVASSSRTSGRLEDILGESYKNKYRMMAFNIAEALSRAMSMALRIAANTGAFPVEIRTVEFANGKNILKKETVTLEDLDDNFDCTITLEPNDPLERDRNLMLLQKLCDANRITWRRLLIDGYGMTEEEADNEIDEVMAETAMRENPIIKEMLVKEAIEKAGGYKYLRELQGMPITGGMQGQPPQPRNLTGDITSKESVAQMLRQSPVGIRRSPSETEQVA